MDKDAEVQSTVNVAPIEGCLSIVATPIGNLDDFSPRARQTLADADRILVEDRRHAQKLFHSMGLHPRTEIFHEHNERQQIPKILQYLRNGEKIAMISDAGMPLVSDPGFPLVAMLRAEKIPVTVVPGPNAALSALVLSGLPSDSFCFEGFLPVKKGARRRKLEILAHEERTLVFYEAPHRIMETLEDMGAILGEDRPAVLCRELTKIYEESTGNSIGNILQDLRINPEKIRGEMTLVVGGGERKVPGTEMVDRLLRPLLAELPLAQAVRLAEAQSGLPHRVLYQRALSLTSPKSSD